MTQTTKQHILSLSTLALLSLARCTAVGQKPAKSPATPVAHRTEIRQLEIHTEPEGAPIFVEGQEVGHSPVSINLEVDSTTGELSNPIYVAAIPISPGEYTQQGLIGPGFSYETLRLPAVITLYMYYNR